MKEDVVREFHVRKSDIDVNRHVNNIRYVDWAFDALPEELALGGTLRRLQIHYKKEVHYGEPVVARTEMLERDGHMVACHGIYAGEELRCSLVITSYSIHYTKLYEGAWKRYLHDPGKANSLGANDVRAIIEDTDGSIWIGTFGGGLNRYDAASDGFERFVSDPRHPYRLGNDRIHTLP